MIQTALHLVDKDTMDKQKALEAALGQIERAFGKGSIMKLGQRDSAVDISAISTGSLGLDIGLGIGGLPRAASSKFTARKVRVKPHWPCTPLPRPRNWAGPVPLSMPSTRLIRVMPASWV